MIGDDLRDTAGQPAGGGQMQEFIGAVGIGMRAEHAGDDELRPRVAFAQHGHERMVPPSPMYTGGLPKNCLEARSSDCVSHSASCGASQPVTAQSGMKVTRAP